jgi:hypothetical protein
VANARARRGSKPLAVARVPTASAGGRAGSVVFCRVRKDGELAVEGCFELIVYDLFLPQVLGPAKMACRERDMERPSERGELAGQPFSRIVIRYNFRLWGTEKGGARAPTAR